MSGRTVAPMEMRFASRRAPWLWGAISAAAFMATLYLTLPIIGALPTDLQPLAQPIAWGGVAIGAVLVSARATLGAWPRVGRGALALAFVGLGLAGLLELSLRAWALVHVGTFGWSVLGPSAGLFALVVTAAVAGFATLVAPRGAALPPALVAVAAALGSGLVVALNLPGAADGLAGESVLIAILVPLAGAYSLVAAFIAVVVLVRGSQLLDP